MLRESVTLKDLDDRHQDVRAWCFACARGAVIDSIMWQRFAARGWPQDLASAAARFTCNACGSAEHVALYPARRPPTPHNAASRLVERFFFDVRSSRKKSDPIAERAAARLLKHWRRR
ncbi:hypothetical protein [Sphingopyxis terrae]|uniref:hypothetical protein n=1 Tax=Sphingopyxis terrae TaxID=33052 RepID=UPI003F7F872B